ncbi:hypothetical protein Dimus_027664, partial [Dionaea muscipula]
MILNSPPLPAATVSGGSKEKRGRRGEALASTLAAEKLKEEVTFLVGVRKEGEKLQKNLIKMKSVLADADKREPVEENGKSLLDNLKVVYDIKDVLEPWRRYSQIKVNPNKSYKMMIKVKQDQLENKPTQGTDGGSKIQVTSLVVMGGIGQTTIVGIVHNDAEQTLRDRFSGRSSRVEIKGDPAVARRGRQYRQNQKWRPLVVFEKLVEERGTYEEEEAAATRRAFIGDRRMILNSPPLPAATVSGGSKEKRGRR